MKIPTSLEKLPSIHVAHRKAMAAIERHGLQFVAYGGIIQTACGAQEVMINNYPSGWNDYYMNSGYKGCDPVIEHALSSCVHSIWTPQMFGKTILSRKMLCDINESGVLSGVTIPVRDHCGNVASVNFSGRSREPPNYWDEIRLGHLYFIAVSLHNQIVENYLTKERSPHLTHITPREQDILHFITEGKTARDISKKIGVTERTVEFHLKNIREKLSATNTVQAIFKAAQLNLIDFKLT